MKKICDYKKGDLVPKEIERLEPPQDIVKITFGCDVEVFKDSGGYHVYPLKKMKNDEYIIVIGKGYKGALIGGFTYIHNKPRIESEIRYSFKN